MEAGVPAAGLLDGDGGLLLQAGALGRIPWVRRHGQGELAEQMTRIALACGLTEERLEEARAGRAALPDLVWEQLERAGRWLVVLDNVDDPGAVGPGGEPVVSRWRPIGGGCGRVAGACCW
ncbi:hypothetical protein [Streptomyces virginiae]